MCTLHVYAHVCILLQECLLILHSVLYKEYQSLKSKRHVEGSKSHVVTDSKNSVFGAYLNKEKSQAKKKFSFSAKNTKVLSWSKQSGWTNFQKMPYNNKLPKSECREVNEVCVICVCYAYVCMCITYKSWTSKCTCPIVQVSYVCFHSLPCMSVWCAIPANYPSLLCMSLWLL